MIQGANGCDYTTCAKRDENNNPTINGSKITYIPVNVNVKYEKETRFTFGVSLVIGNDGVEVGKQIPLFGYTKRAVLSRVNWLRKITEEIYCVKGLVNNGER